MGRKLTDISNLKVGRLLVLDYAGNNSWNCVCDCGNTTKVLSSNLKKASTKSCGCLLIESSTKHSMCYTPTYNSYNSMLQRCYNPKNTNYYKYGAVGVKVIDRWNPVTGGCFENFLEDMGERPLNHTLNRINSSLLYSKDTCEWANNHTQSYDQRLNKRSKTGVAGVRMKSGTSKYESHFNHDGISIRLYYGDSLEDAIKARRDAELKYKGEVKK